MKKIVLNTKAPLASVTIPYDPCFPIIRKSLLTGMAEQMVRKLALNLSRPLFAEEDRPRVPRTYSALQ